MAGTSARLRVAKCFFSLYLHQHGAAAGCTKAQWYQRRAFQTLQPSHDNISDFAFAFDVDGVLLRSAKPLPRAREALVHLNQYRIPFILLTNGGGKHETERVEELSKMLDVPLDTGMFIQSHTPFAELVNGNETTPALKDKCVLVIGGYEDNCRKVAETYGFNNVISPADIITACPQLMPFASAQRYKSFARPLARPMQDSHTPPPNPFKIDAIFVFHDPRDWALDIQIVLDLLLSHAGILGSLSTLNGDPTLPNHGYQQDGQPELYFSNPDLTWAAGYHLPRLGQGGFREALEGVWKQVTSSRGKDVVLQKKILGKPFQGTFEFAEKRLETHRANLFATQHKGSSPRLQRVYMIGDNPESDILGANSYSSPNKTIWHSILVRTGVFSGDSPTHTPHVIVNDVWDAVQWGLEQSKMGKGT